MRKKKPKETIEEILNKIGNPVYPKLSREEDRRCKLSDVQIDIIRRLKNEGASAWDIAKHYNISVFTVYYWASEKVHKGVLKRARKYGSGKKRTEEEKIRAQEYKRIRYHCARYKKLHREYSRQMGKKYYYIKQLKNNGDENGDERQRA